LLVHVVDTPAEHLDLAGDDVDSHKASVVLAELVLRLGDPKLEVAATSPTSDPASGGPDLLLG